MKSTATIVPTGTTTGADISGLKEWMLTDGRNVMNVVRKGVTIVMMTGMTITMIMGVVVNEAMDGNTEITMIMINELKRQPGFPVAGAFLITNSPSLNSGSSDKTHVPTEFSYLSF